MVYLSACVMNVYTIFLFSSLSLYLVSSQVQQLETTLTIVQPPAQPPQLTTPTNSSNQNPPPADLTLNSSNQITPLPGPVCDTLNVTSPLTVGSPATSNVTGSSQKPPGRVPGTSNQTAPLTADSSVTFNATRASQKPLGRVSDTFNQSAPLKVNSTGSTQKSPPSVAQLILPPEAAILPETPESKILVPSQKNDNLPTAIKIAVPHDPTLPPPGSIIVGRQPKPGEHGCVEHKFREPINMIDSSTRQCLTLTGRSYLSTYQFYRRSVSGLGKTWSRKLEHHPNNLYISRYASYLLRPSIPQYVRFFLTFLLRTSPTGQYNETVVVLYKGVSLRLYFS